MSLLRTLDSEYINYNMDPWFLENMDTISLHICLFSGDKRERERERERERATMYHWLDFFYKYQGLETIDSLCNDIERKR